MMGLPLVRPGVAAVLALSLCSAGLVGCKKKDAAAGSAAPAAPAATSARGPGGAESPEALVERMKKAAVDKNMGEVVACLAPKARQEMAAAMYMGATMMVAFSQMGAQMGGAMMEGMTGMAEGMGGTVSAEDKKKADEQAAKTQEQLAKLHDGYNSTMKKYGLPALPKEGEPEPAAPSKEEMDKVFGNIDHGAFVADVLALLESMPGEKTASDSPFEIKEGALENLKIEGDKATGSVAGEAMNFARIDGRWYLDADMMGGGGMDGGMDEGTGAEESEETPQAAKPGI